jgi:hypothetical protein
MANQITNIVVIECSELKVLEEIVSRIHNRFECYADDRTDDNRYELEFTSVHASPKEELKSITDKYPEENLYLQLISYELPNEYLEHHILKKGIWTDKIQEKQNKI